MSRITFLTNNLVDQANISLASGSANAQFPLSNIKKVFTTKVFRSVGNTVSILLDLGSTMPVDTIAFVGDSVKATLGFNTATLKGSGSPDFSLSTEYTIDLSQKYNFGFKQFSEASNRYWLIELTGSSFVEVSNIYLGRKTILSNNDITTQSFAWSDEDRIDIQRNKYGQKFINEYNRIQSLSGDINLINASEYAVLAEISANHGRRKPVWFILDPESAMSIEDSQYIFSGYFYFDKDFKWKSITLGLYSIQIELEEVV